MRGVRAALCALACAAAFPFVGCGGGGGGGGFVGVAGPPIAGKVVAGSVAGATVRVYKVNADRTLTLVAEGTTAPDGTYTLAPSGTGPFLLVASGGTYKDEWIKQDGTWRFRRKQLVHDIAGDMALKNKR